MEGAEDMDKICNALDRLTLDALLLMQEEIELKINAENAMIGGESHLVKARYILGQNNVSSLQLPTENSPETSALLKVSLSKDSQGHEQFVMESQKPDNDTHFNPIKWFGYLTPQSLNYAQNLYKQALQWIVEAANIQLKLNQRITDIQKLKDLKKEIISK